MQAKCLHQALLGTLAILLPPLAPGAELLGETDPGSLASDISAVQTDIRQAEAENQTVAGGLVKSLIALRIATLRQTLALLEQRANADDAHTTLRYTIDGKALVPPADASEQLAAVERELAGNAAQLAKAEAEAARYSGGMIRATALATVATIRQTQAMLDQKRLALKYGFPQFVGFKDQLPSAPPPSPSQTPEAGTRPAPEAAAAEIPADCMKVVFAKFCLGGSVASLPPGPARKTDDMQIYLEPKPTLVAIVDGRIASVGRLYKPGTWLTYRDLETDLVDKYGKGKDQSFFPSYADDLDSKETAIGLKEGRAGRSWQEEGYTVQLRWESRDNVVLVYFHDALEAKRAAKRKGEL